MIIDMIRVIQENKQYLSDLDGAIGDGDHGINMNKGFTLGLEALEAAPEKGLAESLQTLSRVLMSDIGGSMGPLYGTFFMEMGMAAPGEVIDAAALGQMLKAGMEGVMDIGGAQPGDKTMLDVLFPAVEEYHAELAVGGSMAGCARRMMEAGQAGFEATRDMVARVGRASRLGERSRGVLDAGAASCYLLLETIANFVIRMEEGSI